MPHLQIDSERANDGGEDIVIRVPAESLDDFRLMLREQLAGDSEAMRWIREHGDDVDRRSPHLSFSRLRRRVEFLWDLGDRVGGVYSVALPALLLAGGLGDALPF